MAKNDVGRHMILMTALFRLGLIRDRRQIHRDIGPEQRASELKINQASDQDAMAHAEALFTSLRDRVERATEATSAREPVCLRHVGKLGRLH